MIDLDGVTVCYGAHRALDDVTLSVGEGDFALLTGPSGCGKSTLARCLNGLIPHAIPAQVSGRLVVDGKVVRNCPVAQMATSVGLVFQNPATQFFNLTVEEEVNAGPRNLGLSPAEIKARADWAMSATGIGHLRLRSTRALSGGEKQRLAVAAVLAMGPRILVLDEPTASLDVRGTQDILSALTNLNRQEGVTVLVIEHRLRDVIRHAGRAFLMDRGQLVAGGATAEVFEHREILEGLGLRRPGGQPQEDWASLLVQNGPPPGPPIVELRGVRVNYGAQPALRGVDLALHAGEFTALVGDNGSGKSTLARVLAGLLRPTAGEVRVGGRRRLAPGRDVALLMQNPLDQLFCDTVEEEVEFGPRNFGCLERELLDQLYRATGLDALRGWPVALLSSGQQQRTALAAILSLRPKLIILDEPTMGQDWRRLSDFMDFLAMLNREGATILLITHDYKLVHHYARRIVLLREGLIVADGRPLRRTDS